METLKINDKFSVDIDVKYKYGEKYVKSPLFPVEIFKHDSKRCYSYNVCSQNPKDFDGKEVYVLTKKSGQEPYDYNDKLMTYLDVLSNQLNGKWLFKCHYRQHVSRTPELWNMWFDETIVPSFSYSMPVSFSDNTYGYISKDNFMKSMNDGLIFPLYFDDYIHFDAYIYSLYLQHNEYRNDLLRFLKFQPLCRMEPKDYEIYNLKQIIHSMGKLIDKINDEKEKGQIEIDNQKEMLGKLTVEVMSLREKTKYVTDTNSIDNLMKERDEWKSKYESLMSTLQMIKDTN